MYLKHKKPSTIKIIKILNNRAFIGNDNIKHYFSSWSKNKKYQVKNVFIFR